MQHVVKIMNVVFAGVSEWPAADQYGGSSTVPGYLKLLLGR